MEDGMLALVPDADPGSDQSSGYLSPLDDDHLKYLGREAYRAQSPFFSEGFTRPFWEDLGDNAKGAIVDSMNEMEQEAFLKDWRVWARNEQLQPDGDWRTWILKCGRGFGKNRTAVETVLEKVEKGEKGRLCLLGQGESDVRQVMIEGKSGFLACSKSWFRPKWTPSIGGGRLEWPNGAQALVFSAEDPEAVRGHEFDLAWIDEPMSYKAKARQEVISNLKLALRDGPNPQTLYSMTPKAHKWLRELLAKVNPDKGIYLTEGSTYANAENLPGSFIEAITDDYGGTRLGTQEVMGLLLSDTENALWTSEGLDDARIMHNLGLPEEELERRIKNFSKTLDMVIVAVDPNMTASGTSHAAGITVMGMKDDVRYLLADYSIRGAGPAEWGKRVVMAFDDWQANEVVAEVNQGGDLVKYVVEQMADSAGLDVPVHKVHATRGKQKRAEPVAAGYERGKIKHVGPASRYALVETQMCDLHEAHDTTGEDFDRSDSVVWGMTRLNQRGSRLANIGGSAIMSFTDFLGQL